MCIAYCAKRPFVCERITFSFGLRLCSAFSSCDSVRACMQALCLWVGLATGNQGSALLVPNAAQTRRAHRHARCHTPWRFQTQSQVPSRFPVATPNLRLNVQNKNSSYFVEWIPNNIKAQFDSAVLCAFHFIGLAYNTVWGKNRWRFSQGFSNSFSQLLSYLFVLLFPCIISPLTENR